MAKPPLAKIIIFILLVLLLGSAWNIGSRLFLPRASFENLLKHGIRAYNSGQIDQAFSYYSAAIQKQPASSAAQYMLAQSLDALGREDEAMEHYLQTIELDPSQAAPYYNLAVIYNRRNNPEAAIAQLKQALTANRHFHGARFMLAGLHLQQEQYAVAAEELERILRTAELERTFEIEVRTFLARAYTGMEETQKAREAWQKILKMDHTHEEAQEALSKLR